MPRCSFVAPGQVQTRSAFRADVGLRGKVTRVKRRSYWEESWPQIAGSIAWVKEASVAANNAADAARRKRRSGCNNVTAQAGEEEE